MDHDGAKGGCGFCDHGSLGIAATLKRPALANPKENEAERGSSLRVRCMQLLSIGAKGRKLAGRALHGHPSQKSSQKSSQREKWMDFIHFVHIQSGQFQLDGFIRAKPFVTS